MTDFRPNWLRGPAHAWRPGTLDRSALFAQADALAHGPGFDAVARRFAACWLQTQADHPALRAVFRNTPRYLLLVASLVLHHRRDPADRFSGITPGRLLAFFEHTASTAVATSAGQVKAMAAHARLHGLLQPVPAWRGEGSDARLRPLQPTPLLDKTMEAWVRGFLSAMDGVPSLALPDTPQGILDVPGVVPEMFSYRMAALNEDRFVLFEGLPGLRWVLARDHGYRLFLHLVLAAQPLPGGGVALPLPAAALARRAGVTRGTVRNLLDDAQAQGWFDGSAAGGQRHIGPTAWALARHWVARELVWMHGLVCAAHARRQACLAPDPAAAARSAA